MHQNRRTRSSVSWRRVAVFSLLLLLGSAWMVFDSLFSPMASGNPSVEVPEYRGELFSALTPAPWLEVTVEYRYDAKVAPGVVITQTPPGGARRKLSELRPTCPMTLVVSLGEEHLTLPSVVGRDAREATAELRSLGFAVEEERVISPYPEGRILSMEPREPGEYPVGTRVRLSVSAGTPGKTVEVPDLVGLSRSDALVKLWLAELRLEGVTEEPSPLPVGSVIRQSHVAGTLVSAGTSLTLVVSAGIEE